MNSAAQYLVYGSQEALQGNAPELVFKCNTITQALAVAYKHQVDPGTHIKCPVNGSRGVVFFAGLDEFCCDLFRNHAAHFSIKSQSFDGFTETIALSYTREQVLAWLLNYADQFAMVNYVLNEQTSLGSYRLTTECETFFVQELAEE